CKALNVVDLDTGQHQSKTERAIRRHAGCSAWDGVAYAGGVAWDEMDPSGSVLDTSPGFYLRPDGTIVDLGNIGTDSMEPCGDTLVWMVIPHMGQVLAWRPGHRPRVILDPRRAASPSLIQCTEDRWLTTNVDDITGHNEKLRFLALDVSKL
ncbi:MAG: hypothetical protein ACRDQA_17015, partial [Nocardioidaceae bacterium]